ncbi:3-hydroxyacyl-CoA dehydrogenase [Limibaculum sp. M0105]|uniref:3-hydroxyacyl-CoA dehydrogenase n=1 Tax=Thermohalobaculum xanthum TaxID=2753746 RepID=A0A8J7M7Z9_9RHOB|nr:3-hydroxyacyl-CoA dehydrogenase [Thermohalobaculum xanthum]MBK0400256.1 3-hydroxyacyl-CoA dehydrogenase [Thermohalobaculum xanthum]
MKPADAADYVLGVAGAGAMGQGIAQVAAAGGMRVLLLDAREGAAASARDTIAGRLARLAEKGRISADDAEAAAARIEPVASVAALAPCDAVVEAVFEDLEVKRSLFAQIEEAVAPDCIIASNTSSIPIALIARACRYRARIAGLHFFNPVPLMKLVEVIRAAETGDEVVETLVGLGRRMTRVPVVVKDSPGFLVNMGGRAFTTEGLRIAHEGVATPAQIDAIMRDCRGFRMGPFELMDLTGIDVNYPVSQIVWEGYQQDRRLATSANHKAMFDAGLLGRKTGAGWYRYAGADQVDPPSPDHQTQAEPARTVSLAEQDEALATFAESLGLRIAPDDGTAPILAAPIGDDATHTALATGADFRRLVCIDLACDTSRRVTVMTAPGADAAARDAVAAAIAASGRKVTAIGDSPGFVAQRIGSMIANLGCHMAEIGLATPADIETAMRLGLNYPLGPMGLADDLGHSTCLRIMERLQAITGDDRYRPALWLKRRALLGLPIDTPS